MNGMNINGVPMKQKTPQKKNIERKYVSNHDVFRPNIQGPSLQSIGLNMAVDGQSNKVHHRNQQSPPSTNKN